MVAQPGGVGQSVVRKVPGWLLDLAVSIVLAIIAVVIERATEGRLSTSQVASVTWAGSFLFLRAGATLARAGRTLGCLFVFFLTWLMPCFALVGLAISPEWQRVVRDSTPLFAASGLFLILIMVMTFERMRLADQARFEGS